MGGWNDFLGLLNGRYQNLGGGSPSGSNNTDLLQRLLDQSYQGMVNNHDQGIMDLQRQDRYNVGTGQTGGESISPVGLSQPMSLADQLQQQLQSIQPHATPLDQLQKQANASVSAQYDPQINQLLRDMGSTEKTAKTNEGKTKDMYNALAQDFANQLPGVQQNMQAQQQAVASRYNDAKANLQQQYDQQSQDQQHVLQQLGIQAASPDASAQMNNDNSYFQQQNQLSSNQAQDQLATQGNADQNFLRDTSANTRVAGANAANDIASQLSQYMQGAQGKVEDLKGAKGNAIAALVQQLQQTDATNQQNQYNNAFNQMMQLNKFQQDAQQQGTQNQLDMQKLLMQQQNQGANNLFKGTTGMSGMSNFLSEQYPNNPNEASALSSLVASVLQNPDVQMGKRQDGSFGNSAPITNEYMIQLLRNAAQQQGITDPSAVNNAIDALLAYKGQLR